MMNQRNIQESGHNLDEDEEEVMSTECQVMLSYNKANYESVRSIGKALEIAGYKIWYSTAEQHAPLDPGTKILKINRRLLTFTIANKAIDHAAVVLICVSRDYKESPLCRYHSLSGICICIAYKTLGSNVNT